MSGVPYHAWTHAPKAQGGTDPVAFDVARPWIVLDNGGQTLPSGASKFFRADNAWYDPALVTLGDVFDITTQTEDTFDYWRLETKVEGWFTLEYVTFWGNFSTPPGTEGYALEFISFVTTGIPFTADQNLREAKDWSTGAVNGLEAAARLNLYRTIWLPADKDWDGVKVQQSSGSDRDLTGHLKVWYEASNFGGSGDNADWTVTGV